MFDSIFQANPIWYYHLKVPSSWVKCSPGQMKIVQNTALKMNALKLPVPPQYTSSLTFLNRGHWVVSLYSPTQRKFCYKKGLCFRGFSDYCTAPPPHPVPASLRIEYDRCLAPQYLADLLILFHPGRTEYPHLLLLAPPMFFTFRHHWISI